METLNKEIGAALRPLLAKHEEVSKGVVILEVSTLRDPSGDGHSYEYTIRIRAQVVKSVESEETAP
jgi:hypothetical protein